MAVQQPSEGIFNHLGFFKKLDYEQRHFIDGNIGADAGIRPARHAQFAVECLVNLP